MACFGPGSGRLLLEDTKVGSKGWPGVSRGKGESCLTQREQYEQNV